MIESKIRGRDGSYENFDPLKLRSSLETHMDGLTTGNIDLGRITQQINESLPSDLTIDELVELVGETIASKTTIHPDHSILAARIVVAKSQKLIGSCFSANVKRLRAFKNNKNDRACPLVTRELYDTVIANADILDEAICHERDFEFTYFGYKTLERSYLLQIDKIPAETPQFMLMRVSLGIHGGDLERAIETYRLMSQKYFVHASPTLFNSGTENNYLSSCFLVGMKDDSIDGIYKTLHTTALISKAAGGIGLHVHNIRSSGSYIAGSNGFSNGLVPMLRVFNNTARYVDQGGNKRPGAFAIYLEPWHGDVFEFLDLRKNHGKEEVRARDLFYALWIPDLFMERVEKDLEWSLFSPDEAPGLSDCYGEEFKEKYERYEREVKPMRVVKAQKLWHAILQSQTETGGPFMLYKDACNMKSNQKNLGVIKSSNLCCEVVEYSSADEVAVCNLASLALPSYIQDNDESKWYDFEKLHEVTKVVVRNLDKVIDVSKYPVPEAENSNKRHRPIAVGVQGLADTFLELRLPFDSNEAKKLNKQIFETIYHAAVECSIELAKEKGAYETFQGSPASEGKLQFDLWSHRPSTLYGDWDYLKKQMLKYGLRNSLLVAPMPTASTSQILGFNECFEPYTSNIYSRRVLSGEFQVVNKYLLNDLIDLGVWNDSTKSKIMQDNGSIQSITGIPKEVKDLYKTVWEISQKVIIDLAADRAPFIDQSQSMNLHLKDPTMGKLTSMHFYSWKRGLKTGMYYLRTQSASRAIQYTVDSSTHHSNGIITIENLKRKKYVPAILDSQDVSSRNSEDEEDYVSKKKARLIPLTPESQSKSPYYDIYADKVLACRLDSPSNCDSCSG